jgi:hypothetical protein
MEHHEREAGHLSMRSLRQDIRPFVVGLALALAAKGVALFPLGLSVDSYPKLVAMTTNPAEAAGNRAELISQGRFGQLALNEILFTLGIVGPGGNTLYVLLSLVSFVVVGILLCRLWGLEGDGVLPALVVGLVAIHPYHAEIFTFREATLCVSLAVLLAMAGVSLAGHRPLRWLSGCGLVVISLGMYQVAFNYAVIALIVLYLLNLTRPSAMAPSAPPRVGGAWRMPAGIWPRTSALLAALAVYLVIHRLSLRVLGASGGEARRSEMLPLSGAWGRLREIRSTLWEIFISREPLLPRTSKALIAMLCVLAVGALVRAAWRTRGGGRYVNLALVGACVSAATLSVIGVTAPLAMWWPVDRVLAAVSVLVAGALVLVVAHGGPWMRRLAIVATGVLLFSFVGVNNVVLAEQLRLNRRDAHTAGRMIARLEEDPGFATVQRLAVIGHMRHYPLRLYSTEYGSDVNVSAFEKSWSKANVLREVSGYQFLDASPEGLVRAQDYCRSVRPWPDARSVTVLEDTAVVCLPSP